MQTAISILNRICVYIFLFKQDEFELLFICISLCVCVVHVTFEFCDFFFFFENIAAGCTTFGEYIFRNRVQTENRVCFVVRILEIEKSCSNTTCECETLGSAVAVRYSIRINKKI